MSKTKSFALILGVLIMSFLVGYLVLAWTEPTAVPPDGNVEAPLNVSGTAQIKTGGLTIGTDGTGTTTPIFYDLDTTYYIDPANTGYSAILAGKVGIGTTGPSTALQVRSGATNTGAHINVANSDESSWVEFWSGHSGSAPAIIWETNKELRFGEASAPSGVAITEFMRIDADGNVGIGISPGHRLDVSGGDINVSGVYRQGGTNIGQTTAATCAADEFLSGLQISGGIVTTAGSCVTPAGGGDITGVIAGAGLTGGGLSGNVTLNVGAGTGISVAANTVGLSYPAKSCGAGTAIQVFDLGGAAAPTCVAVGGGAGLWTDAGTYIYPANVGTDFRINDTTGHLTVPVYIYGDDLRLGDWGGVVSAGGDIEVKSSGGTTRFHVIGDTGNISWTGTLTGGSVPWARLTSFPSDCPAGQYVYGVGGTLKCSTPAGGGDITGVIAGSGLTGGGLSGNVTLNVGTGTGITVAANTVGLSYPAKSCGAGTAIQAFDLGGAAAPTCVGVAGALPPGTSGDTLRYDGSNWVANNVIYNDGSTVSLLTSPGLNALEIKSSGTPGRRGIVLDADPNGRMIFYGHSWQGNSQFEFRNALDDSTAMTIKTTGNVGIGTDSPNYKLSFGVGTINTKLAIWDGGVGHSFGLGVQSGQFRFNLNQSSDKFSFFDAESGNEIFTIKGDGKVDITGNLTVVGDIYASSGSLINSDSWTGDNPWDPGIYSNVASWMRFTTNGAPFMWYSDGGTGTSPIMELSSGGNLIVSGNLTVGGTANIKPPYEYDVVTSNWDIPESGAAGTYNNDPNLWESITVTQNSTLIIWASGQINYRDDSVPFIQVPEPHSWGYYRITVNGAACSGSVRQHESPTYAGAGTSWADNFQTMCTYAVSPGTYTIRLQASDRDGDGWARAYLGQRNLAVIAFNQ